MPQPAAETTAVRTARDLPVQVRAASIEPSTFREEEGTVDVVWTTGARVRRYDWYSDTPYEEELSVDEASVDMSRFEAGTVQVLDGHRTYGGVQAIMGIATRGSIKDGEGRATLKLSQRPEMAGIVSDIRAGIIRAISFGYSVQRYEITRRADRTDGVNLDLWRAVRWTPQEISFVTVPADGNAGTREQFETLVRSQQAQPCELITRGQKEPSMTEQERAAAEAKRIADEAAARAAAEQAARAAEQQRSADITELCAKHGVAHLAARMIREGATVDAARTAVLDELAVRDAAAGGHRNTTSIRTVSDETETRLRGIEEALSNRVDVRAQLTDLGRQFRGMSLLELGRDHLERSGVNTRGWDRLRLATEMLQFRSPGGMHTTSDFANLLANVAGKRLRNAYTENQPSYRRWARQAPAAPDFKAMNVVQLAGAPDLLRVNEHGEFTYGTVNDGRETYSLITYGRIVALTRQAIINDDLRGFDRLVGAFGNSAARLENRTVYSILTANANMGDNVPLFNAQHGNLAGTGATIDLTTLNAARTAMRVQKGLQNEELNIAPRFLIVPAAREMVAYQFTSPNYVPTAAAGINEFAAGGRTALEVVVESVLDANSATAWYLAADSAQVDTVEYCYLDGASGPVIESEMGFEVDGVSMKCRLDFAAKAIDWRGLWRNAGA
jgi:hypothetical protein